MLMREIDGYEGYWVSEDGYVYSRKFGKVIELKGKKNSRGYLYVGLYNSGSRKFFRVNRLVAIAFIPNPENKPQVNHKDGDKLSNCVSNLEWCTGSENVLHAFRELGRKSRDKEISQYSIDGDFIATFPSASEASRKNGVNIGNISYCANGRIKTAGGYKWLYTNDLTSL